MQGTIYKLRSRGHLGIVQLSTEIERTQPLQCSPILPYL